MRTLIAFVLTLLAPAAVAQTNPAPPDLTNAQAVEPLKDIQGALKDCFKAERESNPDLPGQVVLSYTITEDGKPINVELDSLGGRPVVGCVQAAVATLHWPQFTGQRKQVSVPFTLSNPHSASIFAVAVGATTVSPQGSLTPAEIRAVVATAAYPIRQCYEAEVQRQPGLEGRVVLRWVILSTGAVGDVDVREETTGNESFPKCLMDVVRAMRFPEPTGGGVVIINYPFVFRVTPGATTSNVSGGLAHDVVQKVVNALAFDTCADATADHIERADLRFVVSPDGKVRTAETSGSSMVKPEADACIRGIIKAATFPPATSETRVTRPLVFVPDPPPPPARRPAPAPPSSGCAWPW